MIFVQEYLFKDIANSPGRHIECVSLGQRSSFLSLTRLHSFYFWSHRADCLTRQYKKYTVSLHVTSRYQADLPTMRKYNSLLNAVTFLSVFNVMCSSLLCMVGNETWGTGTDTLVLSCDKLFFISDPGVSLTATCTKGTLAGSLVISRTIHSS